MTEEGFERLVREADAAPMEGWDFSWLDGRATEERPPWGYQRLVAERLGGVESVLDVQTGGGEVLGGALERASRVPRRIAATESWPPNLEVARARLASFEATVEPAADEGPLPFPDRSFELVVSRHPTVTIWQEIARVLRPGGAYLSQQVGPGTNRELTDYLMGPQPVGDGRDPERHRRQAEAAGLQVVTLRPVTLRAEFFDVGAVVWFLRKVIWTVPDFSVARYEAPLRRLDAQIRRDGPFTTTVTRFLIEARK
ncbi:MAG: methyltransferase domain-containing protein [Candidatus Dormibacteraeota bacterium]|nr:methyltransferase domain-containing protein [Candidatus Dormibacteraeota bacterium]